MKKTTIMLPPDLHSKAIRRATALGVSLAEHVRQLLESDSEESGEQDPLLTPHVYKGKAPARKAKEHDDLLYGDPHT